MKEETQMVFYVIFIVLLLLGGISFGWLIVKPTEISRNCNDYYQTWIMTHCGGYASMFTIDVYGNKTDNLTDYDFTKHAHVNDTQFMYREK